MDTLAAESIINSADMMANWATKTGATNTYISRLSNHGMPLICSSGAGIAEDGLGNSSDRRGW